jgi:hypothetical protein
MRDYRARKQGKSAKAKRKAKTSAKSPRGAAAIRANDKRPFEYDATPVIAKHIGPGRPTGYHPLRGDELVALMAEGLCLTAAAGAMGFCYDTLREWGQRHPEFAAAIKRGRAVQTLYLNRKLNLSIDSASVTSAIFGLKNADPAEWRDKQQHEHNTAPDDPLLAYLRSINGRVMRPATPPVTIEAEVTDLTNVTTAPDEAGHVATTVTKQPQQIEGPPRPIGKP